MLRSRDKRSWGWRREWWWGIIGKGVDGEKLEEEDEGEKEELEDEGEDEEEEEKRLYGMDAMQKKN